jgi:predicted phosphodiesterase
MRLVFLSDIHEDYVYLKKILRKIENMGYDKLICLGDISGFSLPYYSYRKSRNASSSLQLLRESCDVIISGNHDMHAARQLPQRSDVFDFPSSWYEMDLVHRSELSKNEIWLHESDLDPNYNAADLAYLQSLPEFVVMDTPHHQILLSHYAYPNLSGFRKVFYTWEGEFRAHFDFMKEKKCSLSFTGHAHPQGCFVVTSNSYRLRSKRKQKINKLPAIIGIPPVTRHRMRSSFCIFDTSSRVLKIVKQY